MVVMVCLLSRVSIASGPAQDDHAVPSDPEVRATQPLEEQDILPPLGQKERRMTLREALQLAEDSSLEARRSAVRTRIASGEAAEARLAWIPALAASAGTGRTNGQVQGSFGDFRDVDFRSAAPFGRLAFGLNPAQTFFDSSAAALRAEGAAADEQAVRRLVLVRVAELYYGIVGEKAGVEVSQLAVNDARDLLRISEALLRQGLGRGDDAERARAELATAGQRLIEAERRLRRASIGLAAALDLDPTEMLLPQDTDLAQVPLISSDIDLATTVQRALDSRLEVVAARRLVEARRAGRSGDVARLASPTIEAFYQEGATGEDYGNLENLTRYGVTATWTISAGGLRRVNTSSARAEEASLALSQTERAVRSQATGAWVDSQAAGARIGKAREAREAAEAALRISQVRFRNGASLAIEVLQAGQALEQARLSEIAAVIDYNLAQVDLRTQLGPVTPGDLAPSKTLNPAKETTRRYEP
jgi:outer membrane protein TolC